MDTSGSGGRRGPGGWKVLTVVPLCHSIKAVVVYLWRIGGQSRPPERHQATTPQTFEGVRL